jgi:hypothetical protein
VEKVERDARDKFGLNSLCWWLCGGRVTTHVTTPGLGLIEIVTRDRSNLPREFEKQSQVGLVEGPAASSW